MEHTTRTLEVIGPSNDGGDYAIYYTNPGGVKCIVGEAYRSVGPNAVEPAEGNARLWSVAHELLAAGKVLLEYSWVSEAAMDDDDYRMLSEAMNRMREAIAKVEGETP